MHALKSIMTVASVYHAEQSPQYLPLVFLAKQTQPYDLWSLALLQPLHTGNALSSIRLCGANSFRCISNFLRPIFIVSESKILCSRSQLWLCGWLIASCIPTGRRTSFSDDDEKPVALKANSNLLLNSTLVEASSSRVLIRSQIKNQGTWVCSVS